MIVLAAGLNHPQRFWRDQAMSDFRAIIETNLTAAAATVDLALPDEGASCEQDVPFTAPAAEEAEEPAPAEEGAARLARR